MVQSSSPGSSEMKGGEKAELPMGRGEPFDRITSRFQENLQKERHRTFMTGSCIMFSFTCTVHRCLVLLGIFSLLTGSGIGIWFWVKSLPSPFRLPPLQDSRCTNVTTEMEWDPRNPFGNANGKKVFFRINRSNFLLEAQVEDLPNQLLLCHENWEPSLGTLICRQLGHFQLTHHKGVNLTDVKVGINQEFLQVSPTWKEKAKERWQVRRRCSSGRIVALKCSECGMRIPETTRGKGLSLGHQPWHVGLHLNRKRVCGGALLSRQWIISAAQCMDSPPNVSNWVALVGLDLPARTRDEAGKAVGKIVLHPSYNPVNHDYGLAMLKLKEPLSLSDAPQAICLPTFHQDFQDGSDCWVSGQNHPRQENSTAPLAEEWAARPVAPQSPKGCNGSCGDAGEITPRMLCAHYLDGSIGACRGESGGALVCQHERRQHLVGIRIRDDGCKQPKKGPGLYTKVASLLDWIHRVVEADEE